MVQSFGVGVRFLLRVWVLGGGRGGVWWCRTLVVLGGGRGSRGGLGLSSAWGTWGTWGSVGCNCALLPGLWCALSSGLLWNYLWWWYFSVYAVFGLLRVCGLYMLVCMSWHSVLSWVPDWVWIVI